MGWLDMSTGEKYKGLFSTSPFLAAAEKFLFLDWYAAFPEKGTARNIGAVMLYRDDGVKLVAFCRLNSAAHCLL